MGACVLSAVREGWARGTVFALTSAKMRLATDALQHCFRPQFQSLCRFFVALIIVFVSVGVVGPSAAAGPYSLQIIAQAGDVIDGRTIEGFSFDPTNVAISNDREVAFFARVTGPDGAGWGLMTPQRFIAGAGKVVDGYVPLFNDEDHDIDMNNRGEVVYTPTLAPAHRGMFVNERLIMQVGDVVDGRTLELIGRSPKINDLGETVVEAWYVGHMGAAIFTPDRLVAEFGQRVGDDTYGDMFRPQINNRGDIIFRVGLIERDVFAVGASDRVVIAERETVAGRTIHQILGLAGIDESGSPVIHAINESPTGRISLLLTRDEVLWQPGDGVPEMAFESLGATNVVLNRNEQLAYLAAELTPDGLSIQRRFLVAGDIIIIKDGDVLGGKTIARVKPNFDMNDHGDVAFRVRFTDDSEAVVLATFVPEPASLELAVFGLMLILAASVRRSQFPTTRGKSSGGFACVK